MIGRDSNGRWQPSLRLYGAGLVAVVLVATGLFTWSVVDRVQDVDAQADKRNREFAREEMRFTLGEVMAAGEATAEKFAAWDETIQQFSQPTYYRYWRDRRVSESGFAPSYLDGLELYDGQGRPLSQTLPDMPAQVQVDEPTWRLLPSATEGHGHLYLSYPLRYPNGGPLRGYMVLEMDLDQAIAEVQRFRHVAVNSVEVLGTADRIDSAAQLLTHLSYNLQPNREFSKLKEIVVGALWNLATGAAVLLLASLFLLVALGSMPLSRLSQQIDRLARGGARGSPSALRGLLPLAEFDKVRDSLDDFHARNLASARAVRDSETRMRAVLDSVVDGIITCDVEGYIVSVNQAVERQFGCDADGLIGRHLLTLVHGLSLGELHRMATRVQTDGPGASQRRVEVAGRGADGRDFPGELALSHLQLPDSTRIIATVQDISERKAAQERLMFLANYDPLTGLPNRALLRDRLEHAMRHAQRDNRLVGVLFMDLDRFKTINDTLGHHCGDQLLREVAERLRRCVRAADTVARLGGDEFMVVVEDMDHVDRAMQVAEKIRASFDAPIVVDEREVFVTPSIGITFYPLDDGTTEALLRNADTAMYRAKELGGNGVQFFTQDLNDRAAERLSLDSCLRHAIANEQFELHYQPRVDIEDGRVVAVEALLRLHDPVLGQVPPDRFIPVLEETGQIEVVGRWVLRQACRDSMAWRAQGVAPLRMAVNISPRQLRGGGLLKLVQDTLDETGLPATGLELEITESLVVENVAETAATLRALSDLGVHIALDDFGTGYSALGYLRRFRIDTLKIDRSFITDVPASADDARVASALVAIAASLDLRVTAEGVETEEQLAFLRSLGCDEVQGFLFSPPLPGPAFLAWLAGAEGAAGLAGFPHKTAGLSH